MLLIGKALQRCQPNVSETPSQLANTLHATSFQHTLNLSQQCQKDLCVLSGKKHNFTLSIGVHTGEWPLLPINFCGEQDNCQVTFIIIHTQAVTNPRVRK